MDARGESCIFIEQLSQTKIQHLRLATIGDHDVSSFDVSMNDAAIVCSSKRVSHLNRNRKCALQLEWPPIHKFTNVLAFDVLHRNEVNAVNLIQIKNRADVWMVQGRREPGFAFKSFEICFFSCEFGR